MLPMGIGVGTVQGVLTMTMGLRGSSECDMVRCKALEAWEPTLAWSVRTSCSVSATLANNSREASLPAPGC